jgi:hypothetical protein
MDRRKILTRAALALLIAVPVFTACKDDVLNPPDPVDPIFDRYVAIGNSLTAGFQSGGINDSTQRESYATLLAAEVETEFQIPLLSQPGCPDPLTNIFTQERLADGIPGWTGCAFRSSPIQERINNVAVVGAAVIDVLSNLAPDSDPNTLTSVILGGRTQLQAAAEIQPTFASVLIGNNDILGALLDESNPGDPALITPPATFATRYTAMLDSLVAFGTIQAGVLIGLQPMFVNATTMSVPYFTAGAAWQQFELAFDAATAPLNALDIGAGCAQAFVPFPVGGGYLAAANAKVDSVLGGLLLPQDLVPMTLNCTDNESITAAELQNIMTVHAQYNATIQQEATTRGWAYFDPTTVFQTTGAIAGQFRPFPAFDPTDPQHQAQPFGGALSLDGIHWSGSFHATYADALEDAIWAEYPPDM